VHQVTHITTMNDLPVTELHVEGTIFDIEYMLRLKAEAHRGLWHWDCWEMAMLYRDLPVREAIAWAMQQTGYKSK
jgi:hypothetical protein